MGLGNGGSQAARGFGALGPGEQAGLVRIRAEAHRGNGLESIGRLKESLELVVVEVAGGTETGVADVGRGRLEGSKGGGLGQLGRIEKMLKVAFGVAVVGDTGAVARWAEGIEVVPESRRGGVG